MKLTKEICLMALDDIKFTGSINIPLIALETLNQLINEHFDNPPLKFEELEEGMWCWDTEYEEYKKITEIITYSKMIRFEYILGGYETNFEENRFYLREVKDDD